MHFQQLCHVLWLYKTCLLHSLGSIGPGRSCFSFLPINLALWVYSSHLLKENVWHVPSQFRPFSGRKRDLPRLFQVIGVQFSVISTSQTSFNFKCLHIPSSRVPQPGKSPEGKGCWVSITSLCNSVPTHQHCPVALPWAITMLREEWSRRWKMFYLTSTSGIGLP